MIVATIDIGTNTILMLIAKVKSNGEYDIIEQKFATPRLGEGIDKTGIISDVAIERAKDVFKVYKEIIEKYKVDKVIANATSAMRDAKNKFQVKEIFESILNSEVEIISGESEAYFSYIGGVPTTEKSALLDIGGGSTEIMVGENGKILFRKSFQIGAVRLTERFFKNVSPIESKYFEESSKYLDLLFSEQNIDINGIELYSVAGTPCALATAYRGLFDYEIDKVHNSKLYKFQILELLNKFSLLNSYQISDIYKISPKRADVITAGALILYTFLNNHSIDYTIVSSKGLRFGILHNFMTYIK